MGSSRSNDLFQPRSASRNYGGLRAASFSSRTTAAAYGSYDSVKTWGFFRGTRFRLWCAQCSARSRQRQALAQLDHNALKDIGVTRRQADAEAAKPFWKE